MYLMLDDFSSSIELSLKWNAQLQFMSQDRDFLLIITYRDIVKQFHNRKKCAFMVLTNHQNSITHPLSVFPNCSDLKM